MPRYVGALDQGTTSTRFMIFDRGGNEIARHQLEHQQILPRPGWVEHDPIEIAARADEVIARAMRNANIDAGDLAAVGITNQRETAVVWNPKTGRPWYNAIVWQDTRTDGLVNALDAASAALVRRKTGLPAGLLLRNEGPVDPRERPRAPRRGGSRAKRSSATSTPGSSGISPAARRAACMPPTSPTRAGRCSWISRRWRGMTSCSTLFRIPRAMLPAIRRSADPAGFGRTRGDGPFEGEIPIAGDLGDQQAATVGQVCTRPGEAKNTYGTGNFMLLNTGRDAVAVAARACSRRSGISSERTPSTRSKVRSPSPAPPCSGCAISSGSSAARPRLSLSPTRSRTPVASTSFPRFPGCSRRTGDPTPAV